MELKGGVQVAIMGACSIYRARRLGLNATYVLRMPWAFSTSAQ